MLSHVSLTMLETCNAGNMYHVRNICPCCTCSAGNMQHQKHVLHAKHLSHDSRAALDATVERYPYVSYAMATDANLFFQQHLSHVSDFALEICYSRTICHMPDMLP
jgi:hypothetical protein